jgi:hypothetical protein
LISDKTLNKGAQIMSPLINHFIHMRWELISALMMFFASQLNIIFRKSSKNSMAFLCSGLGVSLSCWFVMGLLGVSSTMAGITHFWEATKDVLIYVFSQNPPDWPTP